MILISNFSEGRETKKRTTLARLLKGLKTVNRRDRTNNQNTSTQVRVSNIIFMFLTLILKFYPTFTSNN